MGDRVENGKEQTQPDVWGQEIEGILPRILNYWYAVSNSKDDGVPTTGHTHDFGVYIDDVLAILVGESVSGKRNVRRRAVQNNTRVYKGTEFLHKSLWRYSVWLTTKLY